MARISSLNVLLTDTGRDFLAEKYGKVIANIQKNPISSQLKNTDLSGSPTSGTVEAKRFVNATSQAYGTARSGGKANAVKAKPIVIAIDQDEEILEEVEHKDVSLYGVDNFVERRAAECERKMTNKLEHAFFDTAAKAGTQVTPVGTTPEAIAEELIQSVETVSNDFVDGVERNMIALVCNPAFYGQLRTYLDATTHNTEGEAINTYHGVRIFSSTYLPNDVKAIAMAYGSVAQPVLPTIAPAEKIQLSNAYSFGMFYDYGTKAVTEDLIFVYKTA
jgi:hypothetical protein